MWLASGDIDAAAIRELEQASDRAVGVIAGAILDAQLNDILRKEIGRDDTPYSAKVRKDMFGPDMPLGNFAARYNLAYLLGIFSADAHTDLQTFGLIRNSFAHYRERDTFDNDSIKARCANLKLVNTRVVASTSYVERSDGTKEFLDTLMKRTESELVVCLADHEKILASPKGRFLATTKLFCAAFTMYTRSALLKPIL